MIKEINDAIRKLERVKPPMRVLVPDLPKEEGVAEDTIYIVQQEWMIMDNKWVRLS